MTMVETTVEREKRGGRVDSCRGRLGRPAGAELGPQRIPERRLLIIPNR